MIDRLQVQHKIDQIELLQKELFEILLAMDGRDEELDSLQDEVENLEEEKEKLEDRIVDLQEEIDELKEKNKK